jgi:hypothetical protein
MGGQTPPGARSGEPALQGCDDATARPPGGVRAMGMCARGGARPVAVERGPRERKRAPRATACVDGRKDVCSEMCVVSDGQWTGTTRVAVRQLSPVARARRYLNRRPRRLSRCTEPAATSTLALAASPAVPILPLPPPSPPPPLPLYRARHLYRRPRRLSRCTDPATTPPSPSPLSRYADPAVTSTVALSASPAVLTLPPPPPSPSPPLPPLYRAEHVSEHTTRPALLLQHRPGPPPHARDAHDPGCARRADARGAAADAHGGGDLRSVARARDGGSDGERCAAAQPTSSAARSHRDLIFEAAARARGGGSAGDASDSRPHHWARV